MAKLIHNSILYLYACLCVLQISFHIADCGTWGAWSGWSQCIDASTHGYKQRHRKCQLDNGTDIHVTCSGSSAETSLCYIKDHSQCAECNGPPETCLVDYHVTSCTYPNQYCVNRVTNLETGEKLVNRTCGDTDTCFEEWVHKSSNNAQCVNFDPQVTYTSNFSCTYCCEGDLCNSKIKPDWLTWFRGVVISIG